MPNTREVYKPIFSELENMALAALVMAVAEESEGTKLAWTFSVIDGGEWVHADCFPAEPCKTLLYNFLSRKYAVWRETGAVHRISSTGAVLDPPFIPAPAQ